MKNIKEQADILKAKYAEKYTEWQKASPGIIMNNYWIKENIMKSAAYAESIDDLEAMKRCFQIQYKSFEGGINGWAVAAEAIQELINLVKAE